MRDRKRFSVVTLRLSQASHAKIFGKKICAETFIKIEREAPVPFVNPFVPNAPFLYPLKTSENRKFSYIFRRWKKGALGTNGLLKLQTYMFFTEHLKHCIKQLDFN